MLNGRMRSNHSGGRELEEPVLIIGACTKCTYAIPSVVCIAAKTWAAAQDVHVALALWAVPPETVAKVVPNREVDSIASANRSTSQRPR